MSMKIDFTSQQYLTTDHVRYRIFNRCESRFNQRLKMVYTHTSMVASQVHVDRRRLM